MNQAERRIRLINALLNERADGRGIAVPAGAGEQRDLLRALMNVRSPEALATEVLNVQDAYLQQRLVERGGATDASTLPYRNRIAVWRGDITLLKADAIVNAANSQMLGCFVPGHRCIDNAIHTYAGVELRLACAELMEQQGYPEPTGTAKITPAFNLPCKYVLHTVGPIIDGPVTAQDEALLASCYRACLEKAAEQDLESVAFCCISTGEFHFPNNLAAQIAVRTVKEFLSRQTSVRKVIFNVFKDLDKQIYQQLLTD